MIITLTQWQLSGGLESRGGVPGQPGPPTRLSGGGGGDHDGYVTRLSEPPAGGLGARVRPRDPR